MTYPWPGMNPWLENSLLWPNVHVSLITALRDELTPLLRPRYFVAVETRTVVSSLPTASSLVRIPDVMVIHRGGPPVAVVAEADTPYLTVELPIESVEEGYLEVRLVPSGEVVTVIEILSYSNKAPGRDRDAYLAKREELLRTDVGFVEIDLLRDSQPMPLTEVPASDYRLFIRRREQSFHARLYPFGVRQRIPTFPLPLLPDDTEPKVDLSGLIKGVYERAGYDLVIDYNQPPVPPLKDEDAAWAAEVLKTQT
ncbi:MAG: DUF4058 family protein [Anaerolineae bacterium]|nr:DUF4058 family protein [Anaerolineae bacterium]